MLRQRGYDTLSVHELGRNGLTDAEQLDLAAEDGRCLITGNIEDFVALTHAYQAEGRRHTGVIGVPSSIRTNQYRVIVDRIVRLAMLYPDGLDSYTVLIA